MVASETIRAAFTLSDGDIAPNPAVLPSMSTALATSGDMASSSGASATGASASGDWAGALKLVERAAHMIKDYEQKFREVEVDARAYMSRVDVEQTHLRDYILTLETSIARLEGRVAALDGDLHDSKIEAWEAKLKLRTSEARLLEAEAEVLRSINYVKRVEELLQEL